MNENMIEKLLTQRYSVKQMIGYFILGYENTNNKDNFSEILNNITSTLIKIDKKRLVDMIDSKFIESIDLYWSLNAEQVLCYAYLVFKYLIKSKRHIEIQNIISEFMTVSKIYSPDNAVEYIKEKMKK